MKALLMKDLYVLWRQMKIFFLLIVVFAAVPSVFQNTFAILYAAMVPYTAFAQDESSKWNTLAVMMPYSTKEIVVSKYLLGGIAIAAATGITMVFQNVMKLLGGPAVGNMTLTMAMLIAVIMVDITLPLVFRFGVEKGRMIVVFTLAMIGGSAGALSSLGEDGVRVPFNGGHFTLVIAAAATAVSVPLSMKMWERRKR